MKIQKSLLLTVLSIIVAVACATAFAKTKTTVQSDYDKSANFTAYKTFAFVTPLGTEVDGYPGGITQNVKAAAERELESRGYRKVDSNPDLLVNVSALLSVKKKDDALNSQHVGYYGYRYVPVYKTWSSYKYDKGDANPHAEGTLNVDVVDARTNTLVWEGVAIGEVTDKGLADLEASINRVVGEIFAKYPFRVKP